MMALITLTLSGRYIGIIWTFLVKQKVFRFPSCCLCYQKKVFNDIPFQLLTESNQTIIESSTKTIDGTRKIGSERRNLKKPQLRYTHSKYYRWRQLWGEEVKSLKFYKIISIFISYYTARQQVFLHLGLSIADDRDFMVYKKLIWQVLSGLTRLYRDILLKTGNVWIHF